MRIVVLSQIDSELCRLCLACTSSGDLSSLVDCFYEPEKNLGAQIDASTFDRLAAMHDCCKPEMLFICDHGQNIRVAHGSGVQAIIIIRSDAKNIRTYYRIRFPATHTLKAIQFVTG